MRGLLRHMGPLLAGLLLFTWGIGRRGVHIHDEAHFLLAANTVERGVRGVLSGVPVRQLADEIRRTGGTLYFTAKPGHIALIAAAGLATGGVRAGTAIALSILAGLGVILLTQRLVDETVRAPRDAGTLAAWLVATNPLIVGASRSALGLGTSTCFALLAAWFLLRRRWDWRVASAAAGAAAFLAFTCHYNAAVLLAALGAGMALRGVERRRLAVSLAAFLACCALVQGATAMAARYIRPSYPEFRTFLGELGYNFLSYQASSAPTADGVRGFGIAAWTHLLFILATGLVLAVPAAVAGFLRLRRPQRHHAQRRRFVLLWALLPFAVWCMYPWKVERSFVGVVPGIAALAALGIAVRSPRRRADRILSAACAAALVVANLAFALPRIIGDQSPYARAAREGADRIASLPAGSITLASCGWRSLPQWKWYLGPDLAGRLGRVPPAVDFSSTRPPGVLCLDHLTSSSLSGGGANHFALRPIRPFARAATGVGWAEIGVATDSASAAATATTDTVRSR